MRKILIGTRNSPLAIAQAEIIRKEILSKYDFQAELVTFKTKGDKLKGAFKGVKGLFTFELEQALLNNEIDIAVHSLKDLPVNINPLLPILAYSKRADPRDALIGGGLKIGSSSLRRKLQIQKLNPEVQVEIIRGNINTRIKKLDDGFFSGLVLAASGIKRLGLENRITKIFSIEEIMPASGQGILACQGRINENYFYLDCVNDEISELCAKAELSFARALGAGCSVPAGSYAFIEGDKLILKGLYIDEKTGKFFKGTLSGNFNEAENLGLKLAEKLRN